MTDDLQTREQGLRALLEKATAQCPSGSFGTDAHRYWLNGVTRARIEIVENLPLLLTRISALEEALLNIDCAAAVSHNGTEAATITFILTETKRILDPSRATLDGAGEKG